MNETPSEKLTGSLFDRIKDFFVQMWKELFDIEPATIAPFWYNLTKSFWTTAYDQTPVLVLPEIIKMMDSVGVPVEIKNRIKLLYADSPVSGTMTAMVCLVSFVIAEITTLQSVSGEGARQAFNDAYRNQIPDITTLILALYRNPQIESIVKELLHKQGLSDDRIDILLKGTKAIPSPDDYKNLFLRGEISEDQLRDGYKKYGFTDSEIDHLKTLFYPIPSYPDLVRMAVREVFYPDYVAEYGLLQELPGQFLEYAKKQGLSEEWSKHFWAAHWELPSIMQGFEMLHRDVITKEQLDSLFMAVDIMPWWRDKLEKISYNPLTRVDVRRVFRMGIIDRDEVKRTYFDLGYDEEKAEWLTKFTEMEQTEQDRDLTKAEILSAYEKTIINQTTCNGMLLDLGYSQDEVNILISVKDYQTVKEIKARELKRIQKYYLAGAYTDNQTITELGRLDLVGVEQESLMRLWDSEKLAKLKMPSKKDLDTFFTQNVIDENIYRQELAKQGYTGNYINWYVTSIKKSMQEGK